MMEYAKRFGSVTLLCLFYVCDGGSAVSIIYRDMQKTVCTTASEISCVFPYGSTSNNTYTHHNTTQKCLSLQLGHAQKAPVCYIIRVDL